MRLSSTVGIAAATLFGLAAACAGGSAGETVELDLKKAKGRYPYPLAPDDPWLDEYATSMTRDGLHYIGSTGYRYIYFGEWVDWLNRFYLARTEGRALDPDPLDFKRFPKHRAAFDAFFDLTCAGGYRIPNGDTSSAPIVGRQWASGPVGLSWKFSRDPRFAWILANGSGGRGIAAFSSEERKEIEEAAATVKRNPFLDGKSRVMGGFGLTVLEDGQHHDDYRFKRTLILNTGTSIGHHHCDALDLQLFAHGCRMVNAIGCRDDTGTNFPRVLSTHMQNVVDVQSDDWPWPWLEEERKKAEPDIGPAKLDSIWNNFGNFPGMGEAWLESFKPLPDFMYVAGGAASLHHPQVKLYRRQAAMITIDPGKPSAQPIPRDLHTKHDPGVLTPSFYVFDVFRVAGGKIHTWCFHACECDEFGVNVPVRPVGEDKLGPTRHNLVDCGSSEAEHWLRLHPVGVTTCGTVPDKHEGASGAALEAFWRLSRLDDPPGLTMRVSTELHHSGNEAPWVWPRTDVVPMYKKNAEKLQLGADYDPKAPRKVTKLTLLGHEGDPVMYARGASTNPTYAHNLPFLYVQRRGQTAQTQTVWPAVIEPFSGDSKIRSVRLLKVEDLAPSEAEDALRPVPARIETTAGFADVCFADGRPDRIREVTVTAGEPALRFAAESACYSTDGQGLRFLALVNGTQAGGPAGAIQVPLRERQGKIVRIDEEGMRLWTDGDLPPWAILGQELLIENAHLAGPVPDSALACRESGDGHRTSLTVVAAEREGRTTRIDAKRTFLVGRATVLDLAEGEGIVTLRHAPVLGPNPNRRRGLVFAGEDGVKRWRGEFLDGEWRKSKCRYRLTGAPVTKADLPDANGDGIVSILTWEVGVGDVVRAPVHVRLARVENGQYELHADTGVRITLPGRRAELRTDGADWTPLPGTVENGKVTVEIGLPQLTAGRACIRVQ